MTDLERRPLSLYLHFPFCVRKCRYCDFLSFPADEAAREAYLGRLMEEIAWRSSQYGEREIQTLFIGGGTPSLMSGRQLTALMDCLRDHFAFSPLAEMTIECNPGTADREKLAAYKAAGLNRLSFGLQSMKDEELAYLGRIHTVRQFMDNYEAARAVGFENVNIDLMSGLPGQTTASWMETLEQTAELEPEHLSAYSLIIEEGTPFWKLYGEDGDEAFSVAERAPMELRGVQEQAASGEPCGAAGADAWRWGEPWPLPDEDSEREMYHQTKQFLAAQGYGRYEVSNYARPGCECRHNLTYWYRGDYLGMGLGAASMTANRRFSNTRRLADYMAVFGEHDRVCLDLKAQMEETLFLGLRCTRGISLKVFEDHFGRSLRAVYGPIIEKYSRQGFLVYDEAAGRLYLTERGLDVSNWILSDFLL